MIDATINLGNILQIVAMIGGGLLVMATLKSDVQKLRGDFDMMQEELKKLGEVLVRQENLQGQINVLNTRITAAEQDIRAGGKR